MGKNRSKSWINELNLFKLVEKTSTLFYMSFIVLIAGSLILSYCVKIRKLTTNQIHLSRTSLSHTVAFSFFDILLLAIAISGLFVSTDHSCIFSVV